MTHAERLRLAVAKDVKLRMRTGGMLMVADGVSPRHIRVIQLRTWTDGPENETGNCNLRNAILLRKCMRAIVLDKALLETRARFGSQSIRVQSSIAERSLTFKIVHFPGLALQSLTETRTETGVIYLNSAESPLTAWCSSRGTGTIFSMLCTRSGGN